MGFPTTTTKGGVPVIIYTMSAHSPRTIHGAWLDQINDCWIVHSWLPEGKQHPNFDSALDLVWPIKNETTKRKS